jgi:hypothetical protein
MVTRYPLLIVLLVAGLSVGCYPFDEYEGDVDSCSGDLNFGAAEAWLLLDRGAPDGPGGWFGYRVAQGTYLSGPLDNLEEDGAGVRFDVTWEDTDLDGEVDLDRDEEDLRGEMTLSRGGESTECDLDLNWRRP